MRRKNMAKGESIRGRATKIIALSAIGVLVIAGLTLTFMAHSEDKSNIIKISSDKDGGVVKEGGTGDELKETYTLNIENKAYSGTRNVTIKYKWEYPTEPPTDWNVSIEPQWLIVKNQDVEQAVVTVQAPTTISNGEYTIIKIFAWEYLDSNIPAIEFNSTEGVDGGDIEIRTNVKPGDNPKINPSGEVRQTGFAGTEVQFTGEIENEGADKRRFSLSGEVSGGRRAEIWPNAISFPSGDVSNIPLEYGQSWPFAVTVKVPIDADPGMYFIIITATGKTATDSFTYMIDVTEADLYVDELYFDHDTILDGHDLKIYLKIGNKGSKVTEKFGVEVAAETADGAWEIVGIKNITSGLDYADKKTLSFNYKTDGVGILNIRTRIDYNNKITEQDKSNNIDEKKIEVVEVGGGDVPSFFTTLIIISVSVSAVTMLSVNARRKRKQKI